MIENPEPGSVQTLIFDRRAFAPELAEQWAREHGFNAGRVDVLPRTVRLPQERPGRFKKGTLRTVELREGVRAVVGKRKRRGNPNEPEILKEAEDLRKRFVQRDVDETFEFTLPREATKRGWKFPPALTVLGRAVAVAYEERKAGDDNKLATYEHEFEAPAVVCADPGVPGVLVIFGSAIRVDRDGIHG